MEGDQVAVRVGELEAEDGALEAGGVVAGDEDEVVAEDAPDRLRGDVLHLAHVTGQDVGVPGE